MFACVEEVNAVKFAAAINYLLEIGFYIREEMALVVGAEVRFICFLCKEKIS